MNWHEGVKKETLKVSISVFHSIVAYKMHVLRGERVGEGRTILNTHGSARKLDFIAFLPFKSI